MRVLLVNKYWYLRGGTERVVFMTKKVLEQHGHTVGVFGLKDVRNVYSNKYFVNPIDYSKVKGLKKITAFLSVLSNKEAKRKFAAYIKKFKPDVIHFHNIYHQLSFSLVDAAKDAGVPTVLTMHDYHMVSPNYRLFHNGKIDTSSLGRHYVMCFLKNCYGSLTKSLAATVEMYYRSWKGFRHKIDAFIAPSAFMKDLCRKYGMRKQDIIVVPNTLEEDVHAPIIPKGPITYVGRLGDEKGLSVLLQVASMLPDIPFVIVGSGSEEGALKKVASDNVFFAGWQTGKALARYIREARIIVAPSQWYENCPLAILEAIAAGKLVVGSRIGGIPELLSPKTTVKRYEDVVAWKKMLLSWYTAPNSKIKKEVTIMQKRLYTTHSFEQYPQSLLSIYEKVLL